MKLTRKLLCLLLALAMILPMIPTVARAEEVPGEAETDRIVVPVPEEETDKEFPETGNNRIEIPFQINPLYEGLVNEADLEIPEIPEPDEIVTHAATFQSEENAAKTIRSNMKNRTETYTVYVYSTNSDYNALFLELLNNAVVHTGVGTEGDYLMWHLAGWGGEVEIAKSGQGYNYTYTYVTPYYTTAAQEKEMTTAVNNLINSLGIKYKSDYEKVCAVYDWICANVTYDHANLEDSSYTLKFSAYAALVNKTAVCQGYALLFYRLMLELGVDARFIGGDGGGPHAWNIVQLGDYYYTVDATWDAGYTDYKYFLKSTWNFVGHSRDPEFDYWEFHMDHPMAAEDYVHGGSASQDTYINKGYCGADVTNATWAMKRDGTLVIEGEGAMYNYSTSTLPYWYYWIDHINKVEVAAGITSLGKYAFYQAPVLREAVIGATVKDLGESSFENCVALQKVTLQAGLEEIGTSAFSGCGKLSNIQLPETLKTIGEGSFRECVLLNITTLPSGLEELGGRAFSGCNAITSITFPAGLIRVGTSPFYNCASLGTVTISEGAEQVFRYMFSDCQKLRTVKLPSTLKTIGDCAFLRCSALTSITLPKNLESIGREAFASCKLNTITIPDSVTLIDDKAFADNLTLSSVTLSKGLTVINRFVFQNCPLEKIEIPNGVTDICEGAFQGAAITKLVIPSNVRRIEKNAFAECETLTTLTLSEGLEYLSGFYDCNKLESVTVPESVTEIGNYAFQDIENLKSINIPASVQKLGSYAFSGCTLLTKLDLPAGITEIPSYLANGTNLKEIIIPDSVRSIGVGAFQECYHAAILIIPEGVQSLGERCFNRCSKLTEITLPDSVTIIGERAFMDCSRLEKATISGEISERAFSNCTALKEVVILDTVTSVDSAIFEKCKALALITFQGDAPVNDAAFYSGRPFVDVTATAYYPANNPTWTEEVRQNYGGNITWVGYTPECTDHTYDAVVTDPTCTERGYTTYTCTNCGESYVGDYTDPVDHSYEDGTCIWCGDEVYTSEWKSATTSLNGTIDLNIYVVLSENLMDEEDAFIRFSYGNKVVDVPIAEGVESVSNGILRYRYSCPMYAKEVSEIVTVQVMKGDEAIGSALEYSIVTYCMNRINKSTNPAQVALCKALLNYASAAQISLNYNTEHLANAQLSEDDKILPDGIDVSGYAASNVGSETGIKTKSATLMLESEVSVRVYFTLEEGYDISDFTFTIDGKVVEPQKNSTGWFIETDGIAAKNLDQMMEFSVGGITVTYGPMSYVNSKLTNSKTNADTLNLVKALYAYWQAAEALLG